MFALIRKDLMWILPLFVASAITLCVVAVSNHVGGTWINLEFGKWAVLHHLLWIPAMLAGGTLALRDPISGTRELLRHRSVSQAQIYRAQVLLGTLFVLGLSVVWLLFDLFRLAVDGLLGIAFVDLMPLALVVSGFLLAVSCFAVTLISLRLPLGWVPRVLALAVLGFGVILLYSVSTGGWARDGSASVSAHLLVMLLFTIALLWLGEKCTRCEHDPDVALPLASLRPVLWLAAGLMLPLVTLGVSVLQDRAREPLRDLRPLLVKTPEHGFTLARGGVRDGYTLLGSGREVIETAVSNDRIQWRAYAPNAYTRSPEIFDYRLDTGRRSEQVWQRGAPLAWSLVLADGTGALHTYVRTWGELEAPEPFVQQRPDGRGFSTEAFFASSVDKDERIVFIADPADRSVWRIGFDATGLGAPRLENTPLPGQGRLESYGLVRRRGQKSFSSGLVCADQGYLWDGKAWVAGVQTHRPQSPYVGTVSVLAPVVAAPEDAGAAPPQQWTLSPHGLLEWSAAALFVAPSLLRPLPSALWAVLSPDESRGRHWSKGLLLGEAPWLLILPVLGTLFTLWIIRRRLRQLRADAVRARHWGIAVLVLGPGTLLILALVETTRAHRRFSCESRPEAKLTARRIA